MSALLRKKAITKNNDAGTNQRNAFKAKNTCASLYISCGVKATPAKKTIPMKNSTAAIYAQRYEYICKYIMYICIPYVYIFVYYTFVCIWYICI